jgi:Fur family transcriptional regulator, zinc uptake regulator
MAHAHDHDHDHERQGLTRNQKLVLEAVESANAPQSAYDLLGKLRPHGVKAPLQVYRALDQLVKHGLVHKLESMSAFVACQHPSGEGRAATVFMICDNCGNVSERTNDCISGDLSNLAKRDGFAVAHTSIELHGHCGKC